MDLKENNQDDSESIGSDESEEESGKDRANFFFQNDYFLIYFINSY